MIAPREALIAAPACRARAGLAQARACCAGRSGKARSQGARLGRRPGNGPARNPLPLLSLLLLSAALPLPCAAAQPEADYIEMTGTEGGINWTRATVEARGIGVPPERARFQARRNALACRAAKVDAQRNLLESTKGVRIDGRTLIRDAMVESDLVQSSVSGTLRAGSRVVARRLLPDGSCEVTMRMPLQGSIASAVYGMERDQGRNGALRRWIGRIVPAAADWLIPPVAAATAPVAPSWQDELRKLDLRLTRIEKWLGDHRDRWGAIAAEGAPTGLVIDARGSNFIPSMSPKIIQLRGGVLYPDARVRREAARHGVLISLFMRDLMMAQKHPRVGERPLVLKALRTWGKTRTALVLGKEASARLKELIAKGFLDHAAVIVVMD
ncbi:MAG: hypothetical protein D6682_02445 [Zetaproteobacteria bacterium]|nr:MAG: hypothetical protein D6682_02445 [Zetaproteobacteria bacterium]